MIEDRLTGPAGRGQGYAWYVVTVLLIAGITSYLDRNILFLLVDPIRQTLGLTDTQISLLEGLAFAFFFIALGYPLGGLVDRRNRRNLIVLGVAIWTVMTFACGLARSYPALFVARMGVGFGEAILGPAAYSMIGDYFAPARRARAASIYNMSNFLGGALSSFVGGAIVHAIGALAVVPLPLLGDTIGWRVVFFAAAAPGVIVVLLLLTVAEPPRSETGAARQGAHGFWQHLRAHRPAYLFVYSTYVSMTFIGLSTTAWGPSYLIRSFGLAPGTAGMLMGTIGLVALVGAFASGWLSDRFAAGRGAGRFRTPLVGWPLLALCVPGNLLAPSLPIALLFSAGMLIGGAVILVSCPPVLQDITPNRYRGRAQAIFFILSILLGMGVAPTVVALATDRIFHDPAQLRYSLLIVQMPAVAIGWLLCRAGQRPYAAARAALAADARG
ncbi:MAG: MFS transporter [Sphingomonas fennica]